MIKKTAYGKAKEAGVCFGCGVPSETPRCERCQKIATDRVKELRKARKDAGKCTQCGNDSDGKALCHCCSARARLLQEGLDRCDAQELLGWVGRRIHSALLDAEADHVVAVEQQDFAKAFGAGQQMKVLQKLAKDVDLARSASTRGSLHSFADSRS